MNRRKLQQSIDSMAARRTSFPVLVLDGSVPVDGDAFRATLYGADFQPVSPETTNMTQAQIKTGNHFMHRMRTRAEWEKETAQVQA